MTPIHINGLGAFVVMTALPLFGVKLRSIHSSVRGREHSKALVPYNHRRTEFERCEAVRKSPILQQTALGKRILANLGSRTYFGYENTEGNASRAVVEHSRLAYFELTLQGYGTLKAICVVTPASGQQTLRLIRFAHIWLVPKGIHRIQNSAEVSSNPTVVGIQRIYSSRVDAPTRSWLTTSVSPLEVEHWLEPEQSCRSTQGPLSNEHFILCAVYAARHYLEVEGLRADVLSDFRQRKASLRQRTPALASVELQQAPLKYSTDNSENEEKLIDNGIKSSKKSSQDDIKIPSVVSHTEGGQFEAFLLDLSQYVHSPGADCPIEEIRACIDGFQRTFELFEEDLTPSVFPELGRIESPNAGLAFKLGSAYPVNRSRWNIVSQKPLRAQVKPRGSRLASFFKSDEYHNNVALHKQRAQAQPVPSLPIKTHPKNWSFQGRPEAFAKPKGWGYQPSQRAEYCGNVSRLDHYPGQTFQPDGSVYDPVKSPAAKTQPVINDSESSGYSGSSSVPVLNLNATGSDSPKLRKSRIPEEMAEWWKTHYMHHAPQSQERVKIYSISPVPFPSWDQEPASTPVLPTEDEDELDWSIKESPCFKRGRTNRRACNDASKSHPNQTPQNHGAASFLERLNEEKRDADDSGMMMMVKSGRVEHQHQSCREQLFRTGIPVNSNALHQQVSELTKGYPDPFVTRPMNTQSHAHGVTACTLGTRSEAAVVPNNGFNFEFQAALALVQNRQCRMVQQTSVASGGSTSPGSYSGSSEASQTPKAAPVYPRTEVQQSHAGPSEQIHRSATPELVHPRPRTSREAVPELAGVNIDEVLLRWEEDAAQPPQTYSPSIAVQNFRNLVAAARSKVTNPLAFSVPRRD